MRRLWFLGGLTEGGVLMAIKLDCMQIEFNVGYRLQEVQISSLQGAQKSVLS